LRIRVLAGLLVLLAPAGARAQSMAAGQIFEIGAGGRGPGMGSAGTALARDVSSLYYNPAGMGLLSGRQVSLMQANLYGGASLDYLGYAQNFSKRAGGWGLQLVKLSVAGKDGRDATNKPGAGFNYAETGISYGMGWRGVGLPDMSAGLAFNMLSRSLGNSSDRLIGIDVGAQYGPMADDKLTLGLAARNAFSMSQGDTSDKLPMALRMGAAYQIFGPLTLALDVSSAKELRIGTEYAFGSVALRAGYAPEGMSFGGGLLFRKSFSLDMAVVNSPTFGMSQRVTLGYRFGTRKPAKTSALAEEYLNNGKAELAARDYLKALSSIETSLGIDPAVGGREWKRKAKLLRELLKGMDMLDPSNESDEFKTDAAPALLTLRSVMPYLEGRNSEAVILAHVAAGSGGSGSVFMRFLQAMAKATGQSIVRDDIVPPETFMQWRHVHAVQSILGGHYDVAERMLRESLIISPEDSLTWTRLGSAYFASGNKTKALEAYRKALELEPTNAKLRTFVETALPH